MIGLARILARAFARVEPRHWAGVGASAALHLAVILGWQPAPPPEPEAISFEVTFEPVKPLPVQKSKVAAKKVPVSKLAKNKPKKLASKKPPKLTRESHLLDMDWRAERQAAKNVPELALPDARSLGIPADKAQAELTLKPITKPAGSGTANARTAAGSASDGAELAEPQVATIGGAQSATTQSEGGLALSNATTLSSSQRAGAETAGAQASNAVLALAGGAEASDAAVRNDFDRAMPAQTAQQTGNQAGNGRTAAAGAEASAASTATLAAEAAAGGSQLPGVRLAVSGVLSNRAALPAGVAASFAAPQAAALAQAAQQADGKGSAQLTATKSAAAGQSVRPGVQTGAVRRGDAAQADLGDSRTRSGVRSPESGGRLSAGMTSSARSSAGAGMADRQPGRSGQQAATLALASGEPGSSPGLAVTLQPLLANAPAHVSAGARAGRGNVAASAAGGRESFGVSAGAGLAGSGSAAANTPFSPFAAASMASVATGMPDKTGRSAGGIDVTPANNGSSAVLAAAGGSGRPPVVLHATQPPAVKVVRPDSEIQRLDVLAPSNYCPLPLPGHAQPDNRAPKTDRIIAEHPAYAPDNPGINYPVLANIRGVEGRVTVRVEVLSNGRPGKMWLKQSSGSGILDQDAQAQLKQWRFTPARRNGQPVTAWIDVPVHFRLSQARP